MSQPPEAFGRVADSWRPEATAVEGVLDAWPAQALAALLDTAAPAPGDPMPPLWHEVYLHETPAVAGLDIDGHPSDALVPPLPERRRMFGGGSVEVLAPLRVGERARRTSRVVDVRIREGRTGWLLLATEQHELTVDGQPRVRDTRDIVYRMPADVAGSGTPPVPAAEQPEGRWQLTLDTDERLLFLYSALTYNAHRIHYDADYVTKVEGHPGLLVHGPLIATGCVEVARRAFGSVDRIDYRLVAPAYCGAPVSFHADEPEGGVGAVWAVQSGRVCARAEVRR